MEDDYSQQQAKRQKLEKQMEHRQDQGQVQTDSNSAQHKKIMQQRDLRIAKEQQAQQLARQQRDQLWAQQLEGQKRAMQMRDAQRVQQLQQAQARVRQQQGR
jgi:hypothetical protein